MIPDGVTRIDRSLFSGCKSLTSVTIPASVKYIATNVFFGCDSLLNVYYLGSEEEWIEIDISSGNDSLENATVHYNYNS